MKSRANPLTVRSPQFIIVLSVIGVAILAVVLKDRQPLQSPQADIQQRQQQEADERAAKQQQAAAEQEQSDKRMEVIRNEGKNRLAAQDEILKFVNHPDDPRKSKLWCP